jgi:hypothetical protein
VVTAKRPRRRKTVEPRQFYAEALSEAERADLPLAREIDGVDQEIALLRLRLRSLLAERPEDFTLMLRGVDLLTKAVSARYRLSKQAREDLSTALAKVVRGMAETLPEDGIDV